MKVSKQQARTIQTALEMWAKRHVITHDLSEMLSDTIEVARFNWKRLAQYAAWLSIACIILAMGAMVTDKHLIQLAAKIPAAVKCLPMAAIAAAFYTLGIKRRQKHPAKRFGNEAIFFLGVLATATAVAFFGEAIDTGSGHFSIPILLSALIYGVLGLWLPSKPVWVFALIALGGWLGAETGYLSGWGSYYLGMNYPLRFVIFGAVLIAAGISLSNIKLRESFSRPTLAVGFLSLFVALWILSIVGNYPDLHAWQETRHLALIHWSLLFGVAAMGALYFGLRKDDAMARGFGITFLIINLYTRFFEYFWDSLHKTVFFALLAASFWFIGLRAEKRWNPHKGAKKPAEKCR